MCVATCTWTGVCNQSVQERKKKTTWTLSSDLCVSTSCSREWYNPRVTLSSFIFIFSSSNPQVWNEGHRICLNSFFFPSWCVCVCVVHRVPGSEVTQGWVYRVFVFSLRVFVWLLSGCSWWKKRVRQRPGWPLLSLDLCWWVGASTWSHWVRLIFRGLFTSVFSLVFLDVVAYSWYWWMSDVNKWPPLFFFLSTLFLALDASPLLEKENIGVCVVFAFTSDNTLVR